MKPAKLSIVRVSLVFSCLLFFAVSASAQSSDYSSQLSAILSELNNIYTSQSTEAELNRIRIALTGVNGANQYLASISSSAADTKSVLYDIETLIRNLNIPDYSSTLSTMSSNLSGLKSANHTDLAALKSALLDIYARQNNQTGAFTSGFNQVSNLLEKILLKSVGGQDVLAGNPWWATNSAFTLTRTLYNQVYPDDGKNNGSLFSFPQFVSKWSAMLTYPNTSGSITPSQFQRGDWARFFGYSRVASGALNSDPYSWFDWMADASRSNWVLQATAIDLLSRLSNSSPSSVDYLAGNPWWATNSGFVTDYYRMTRNGAYPPSAYPHDSFPVFASQLAASIYQPNISDYPYSSDYMTRWGRDGANWNNGVYTWFDWVSDYFRSNLVLTTALNATNIDEELYLAGYDTDTSDTITNTPLPEYSLPSSETISEAENVLEQGEQQVTSFIESLPQPGTGGDPEIVVIPEFTVGGIHVREYRASLNSPIVPTCHAVLSFLYAVGLACFVFKMAKSEYVYYATIGRQWGRYD